MTGRSASLSDMGDEPPPRQPPPAVAPPQRRIVRNAAIVVCCLVAISLSLFAWHKYREWDLGTLILVAEDSPLVTEIVDPQTGAIVARETVDGEHQFLLSSGTYQVRFAKKGDFSQTIDITLSPGTAGLRHTLRPNNHWIFKQQLIALGVTPLEGRGRGLLHWTNGGVELQRQGEASQLIPLSRFDSSYDPIADSLGFRWPPSAARVYGAPPYRLAGRSPWVHTQGIDFNSDGALDILCAGRHQAWLMALSGRGNEILWLAGRGSDLEQPPEESLQGEQLASAVAHPPSIVPDLDGDNVPDILATLLDQGDSLACRRWIEATSGRTGELLWRYELPEQFFDLSPGEHVPYGLRWHAASAGWAGGDREPVIRAGHLLRGPDNSELVGWIIYKPDAPHLFGKEREPIIGVVAGCHLLFVDLKAGEPVGEPIDLGFRPSTGAVWGDVDGDRRDELVLLERLPHPTLASTFVTRLHVWSCHERKPLWSQVLEATPPRTGEGGRPGVAWPLVADLDGDGRCEILVPRDRSHEGSQPAGQGLNAIPWGELALLAGDTGQIVWSRKLASIDTQIDHFRLGPDIDGDGVPEILAATLCFARPDLYVDALSGKTGDTLWTSRYPLPSRCMVSGQHDITWLNWWRGGPAEESRLAVSLVETGANEYFPMQLVFSADSGQLVHSSDGVFAVAATDYDGDDVEDLVCYTIDTSDVDAPTPMYACFRGANASGVQDLTGSDTTLPDQRYGLAYDPRMLRALPWKFEGGLATSENLMALLWSSLLAVALIILPVGYLCWMVARQQFGLKTLLVLPLIASVSLVAAIFKFPDDHPFPSTSNRFLAALLATAPLLTLVLVLGWLVTERWKKLFICGMAFVALSVVLAGVSIAAHLLESPMIPEEGFDWSTWHHILPGGACATSWLLVGWTLIMGGVNRLGNWFERRRRPQAPPGLVPQFAGELPTGN